MRLRGLREVSGLVILDSGSREKKDIQLYSIPNAVTFLPLEVQVVSIHSAMMKHEMLLAHCFVWNFDTRLPKGTEVPLASVMLTFEVRYLPLLSHRIISK